MTRIVVLPNENLCPEGAVFEAGPGETVCRALRRNENLVVEIPRYTINMVSESH